MSDRQYMVALSLETCQLIARAVQPMREPSPLTATSIINHSLKERKVTVFDVPDE